jgi:hypothetical protein
VEACDAEGKSLGVAFHTATPFATPVMMEESARWFDAQANEEFQQPAHAHSYLDENTDNAS